MSYEENILASHSTAGLKKCALDRAAKRDHLAGMRMDAEEARIILDDMFGPEPETPPQEEEPVENGRAT